MIEDICSIKITEKVYSIPDIAKDFNMNEKQIRRKLRSLYGNYNDRWIITQTQYE